MEELLTPSYHGENCRHNGDNPDYEIACDECDFYLLCFPDWEEILEIYDNNGNAAAPIRRENPDV